MLRLTIIIPALDEADTIGATIDAARRLPGAPEVIVVDGGSRDATVEHARARGAVVTTAPRGRGGQLHAGAALASGDVLWFLHADTLPPPRRAAAHRPRAGGPLGGRG